MSLIQGSFYHIYNRGNNRENIFIQERNYDYFINLWWKHISPIAETWAYCLLRNHFHALVFIKDQEDISTTKNLTGLKQPSQCFSNFFNAYTRGVNIATQRTGALFERPFKRIPVENESYLIRLIVYIHQNPQIHKFEKDFSNWKYSSYQEIIGDTETLLQREKMMQKFGGCENFIKIHQDEQPLEDFEDED